MAVAVWTPQAAAGAPRQMPSLPPLPVATAPTAPRLVALAIRTQVDGQLRKFYASRGFWPLWATTGRIGSESDALIGFLASADLDGLKPSTYKVRDLRAAVEAARTGDARAVARAELALSRALARYVGEMRRPAKTGMVYLDPALEPQKLRAEAVLRAAAVPSSFRDYVTAMGWMSPHYVHLRELLERAGEQDDAGELLPRLRLNLDRARVLPGPWTHHIVVDAASGQLWFYQAGKPAGTMRVVVGKPEAPTPMLAGMLHYAILNPYWNIPVDLAQTNVAPKVLAGRSLKSMRMEALSDWGEAPRPLNPATIDWHAIASGAQEIRLRQLPGGNNAMGRVKFMFPNDHGIYLHDTPDKELLTRPDRHFSNGCIRLENAAMLGRWLLGKPLRTTLGKPEEVVALPVPVPVYLTYITATDTPDGVTLLPDVYGRDRQEP